MVGAKLHFLELLLQKKTLAVNEEICKVARSIIHPLLFKRSKLSCMILKAKRLQLRPPKSKMILQYKKGV